MSQNEAPTEEIITNPVGTQDSPVGGETPATPDLKKVVAEAVSDMFKVDAWKPRYIVKFKIQCPSGQTALVKHLDTLDLLEFDLIEELDFFTRKLFPSNIDASGNPVEAQDEVEQSIWTALKDPEKRRRFLDMTGKLMAAASVDPKIVHDGVALKNKKDGSKVTVFGYELSTDKQLELWGKPIPALKDREVYSGYIDFADRMTFFTELNKPMELIQPFREEQAAMLQDLARGEGTGSEAK